MSAAGLPRSPNARWPSTRCWLRPRPGRAPKTRCLRRKGRSDKPDRVPRRLRARELPEGAEDHAVRTSELFQDREVVVLRDRQVGSAQAVALPSRSELFRLANELGKL